MLFKIVDWGVMQLMADLPLIQFPSTAISHHIATIFSKLNHWHSAHVGNRSVQSLVYMLQSTDTAIIRGRRMSSSGPVQCCSLSPSGAEIAMSRTRSSLVNRNSNLTL